MNRETSKLQNVGYILAIAFAGCSISACSPQQNADPCAQLLACCDRLSGGEAAERQCRETYDAYRTRPDAESLCEMAIDAFVRAGVTCDSTQHNPVPGSDGGVVVVDGGEMPISRDGGASSDVENTLSLCSDGVSNDGDPYVDCDDYDCCSVVSCGEATSCGARDAGMIGACVNGPENTVGACTDGCSNDGDRFVDCDDYDCCGTAACSDSDACRSTSTRFVSTDVADCVGTGTVSYTFGPTVYNVVTIAIASSSGYTIFGYTRDSITSGPFPLRGMEGERQVRAGPWEGGLALGFFSWNGTMWSTIEGGSATFSDDSIVSLATDAESLYQTHACIGFVRGSATAAVTGGVDYMHFEFMAPVIARGFPGV